MPSFHEQDRRRATRVDLERVVQLRYGGGGPDSTGVALNLSASGVKVCGVRLAPVGELVRLRIMFSPREPILVDCRVSWAHSSTTDLERGEMGLTFEAPGPEVVKHITRLVHRLRGDPTSPFTTLDPFAESGTWAPDEQLADEAHSPRRARRLAEVLAIVFGVSLLIVSSALIYFLMTRPD